MTGGKAIANTRHAWANVYCRSCKRIVSYQAEMVTTTREKPLETTGGAWAPRLVDVVECACGALIELGGR